MTIIEQVHRSLPQTMTKEKLAKWVTEQQKQVIEHIEKTTLSPEEVAEYEHKSSMASRAIDKLDGVKEEFMFRYKKGTEPDPHRKPDEEKYLPYQITIPPTKGVDALKKNREFADEILEKGYTEVITKVYMIPNPEESQMVAVTIEGHEVTDYTRAMTKDEDQLYGKVFMKENGELRQLDNSELSINGDGTAKLKTKKQKREPII